MATEDWIQESLARLESLEEERSRHEAALETADDAAALRMHAQAVERLDAKIRALYAELEAAAEQGDGADASTSADDRADVDADDGDEDEDDDDHGKNANVEVETRLFRREEVAAQAVAVMKAAPVQAAPVSSSPVAAPFGGSAPAAALISSSPVAAASPFGGSAPAASPFGGSAPEASPFGGSAPASTSFSSSSGAGFSAAPASSFSGSGGSLEDDEGRRSGGAPWGLIIALVVVVGGVGGYFALRPKDVPPPEVPTGPTKVIKMGEVPLDTQGPKVVKGSNVDSVTGTQFKEGRPQPSGGSGGGASSTATPTDKPKKKDPRTKIESTDDPLAGIDK